MKLTNKSFGVLLAAAVLTTAGVITTTVLRADDKAAGATNSSAGKTGQLFPDTVIAKGKGVEIKRSQLDEAISGIRAAAMSRGQTIPADEMPRIERATFDHLVQVQLFNMKATDADKAKGKTEGDERMELIRKRAPSEEALARQLKALSMTVDQLHGRLIEEATAEAALRDNVKIADDEIKKFYEDNPSKFEEPEKVRVSHILISTGDPRGLTPMSDDQKKAKLKIAQDLLKRAKAGEDFAKLAKENSEDPGSKDNGGEYPAFPRGTMVKEFEAAAFSLQTNQISDIVTTAYGYHIIKLLEKTPAQKLEFAKVSPDIKKYLETVQMEKILPDYYTKLKKEVDFQILDPDLKKLEDMPLDIPGVSAEASPAAKSSPK